MTSATSLANVPTASDAPTLPKSDQNLVWIDCEMSGLDPEKERLLEIAVVTSTVMPVFCVNSRHTSRGIVRSKVSTRSIPGASAAPSGRARSNSAERKMARDFI